MAARNGRGISMLLWVAAFVVAVMLGYFQRTTGPTYPMRGSLELAGTEVDYRLPRTHGGKGGLEIRFPTVGQETSAEIRWRRFPSKEEWRVIPMARDHSGALVAEIPHQPPAGKVEYTVVIRDGSREVDLPREGDGVVARFRGDVPAGVLIPHILAMFGSMLLATRALFEVVRPKSELPRGIVLAAMMLLVLGGLFLGPVVQKFAFDAYWTGWPFGHDLTDNKTAVAVIAWLPATVIAIRRSRRWRAAVALGWVVMMGVFLIPHSLRGSELDWSEHDRTAGAVEQAL